MSDTIRQLEERVAAAVKRMSQLAAEKQQLQAELALLQERLAGSELPADGDAAVDDDGWQSTRHELLQLIRQTLDEVREPGAMSDGARP